jgi:hypothetical protein
MVAWLEVSDNKHFYQNMEYNNHETLLILFFKMIAWLILLKRTLIHCMDHTFIMVFCVFNSVASDTLRYNSIVSVTYTAAVECRSTA